MKEWTTPEIAELDLKETAWVGSWGSNGGWGCQSQPDLGTCSSSHWAGNGKTLEEALQDNPYWHNTNSTYWVDTNANESMS